MQQAAGDVDSAAERGAAAGDHTVGRRQGRGETGGAGPIVNELPTADLLLLAAARPLYVGHRHRSGGAGGDRVDDPFVPKCRGITGALQGEFLRVDAQRHVDGEDERDIDRRFGVRLGSGGGEQRGDEGGPTDRLGDGSSVPACHAARPRRGASAASSTRRRHASNAKLSSEKTTAIRQAPKASGSSAISPTTTR